MTDRDLIVNADDFGRCRLINAGIRRSHEEGIVTSASLMVRWEGAGEAAAYAREHRSLAVGLHLDLGECWAYRRSRWEATYEVVRLDDAAAVEREALSQLGAFRRLLGRYPTHIDSHQHVHGSDPVRRVAREIAGELNVPLRGEAGGIRYCGDFYGKTGRASRFTRRSRPSDSWRSSSGYRPARPSSRAIPATAPRPTRSRTRSAGSRSPPSATRAYEGPSRSSE